MDIIDLELVADNFEPGKHKELDEIILRDFSLNLATPPSGIVPYILHAIVEQLGSCCLMKYNNMRECKALLDNPAIYSMITDGVQNGFKKL